MGLDLTLLPVECDKGDWGYSHTVLSCLRDYELFDAVMELQKKDSSDVPKDFTTYVSRAGGKDSHYGKTQTTAYGDKMRTVSVADLLTVKHLARHTNVAVWAYLEQLPPDSRVALYWR